MAYQRSGYWGLTLLTIAGMLFWFRQKKWM
jgi:hypothetical protein